MKKLIIFFAFALGTYISNAQLLGYDENVSLTYSGEYTDQGPVYIVCATAVQSESVAQQEVKKLNNLGYHGGYLWIPNYASLSGAKYYSVFIGPFSNQYDCEVMTETYKKINKGAYGLIVDQESRRMQINGIGKVTITSNNKVATTSNNKDFSKISGVYKNNSGDVRITYVGKNKFSFSISVGNSRGCMGDIADDCLLNSNGVGNYSTDGCSSLVFRFNGRKLTISESGCSGNHGQSCSFDGEYLK